jgi:UDP-N-acetylmuramate-alanine ligase
VTIFEPNTGNRKSAAKPSYDQAFTAANEVIIPQLSKIKHDPQDEDLPFDGENLAEIIAKTHPNVKFIADDKKLIQYLLTNLKNGDCVVFLGSHGFRGMIEELIAKL